MLREFRARAGATWCNLAHDSLMWPVHGYYECRTCGRRYPAFAEAPLRYAANRPAYKPVATVLLAIVVATLAGPARAAEAVKGHPTAEAAAALERYTGSSGAAPWGSESVEIHAAIPKLDKTGELRAIRRPAPLGESSYEVLQASGDRTVKEQVIARYLKAEEQASEMPAASVAITPANYKFEYVGKIDDGERLAYAFRMTPRKKRVGLIKGELWLDQRTGVPVLESGKLVKSPSIWIPRVAITLENTLRDGVVQSRLTHVNVDTRVAGRAELVMEERPLEPTDRAQFPGWDDEGGQQ